MSIIIITEKVIDRAGIRIQKIKRIKALAAEELPLTYLENDQGLQVVWFDGRDGSLSFNHGHSLFIGEGYEEGDFQERLEYVRRAGENLKRFNQELAEKRRIWNGNGVFII